jgi:hypothetical protein
MKIEVSKEKGGQYYAHPAGHPEQPIKGSFGDKRKAIKFAARLCGVTPAEYMREAKKGG